MKARHILLITVLLFIPALAITAWGIAGNQKSGTSCMKSGCHNDLRADLHEQHPKVSAGTMDSCLECHNLQTAGLAQSQPNSTGMHMKHLFKPKADLDCKDCHVSEPDRNFGFPGISLGKASVADIELNKKVFRSWATSANLDAAHAKKQISCGGCHGKSLPRKGDSVENDRCLLCHGRDESLADRSIPAQFPDRNPHLSHLGQIGCTVCHKAHKPSMVYCLECHKKYKMEIKIKEASNLQKGSTSHLFQ